VELHGGTVTGTSSGLDQGSTFIVKLPLAIMREGMNRADHESPLRFHKGVLSGLPSDYAMVLSGLKVLVVDDEADSRELMSIVLQQCGAEVQAASSTREALKLLGEWRPDVLVSDIGMPVEDGYVLIKKVRSLHPDQGGKTPAAALTAYARSEDRLRALAAGYHTHVVKPVEPSELVAVVASLAGRTGKHR
jgi:CheY-like chemotaxis protein